MLMIQGSGKIYNKKKNQVLLAFSTDDLSINVTHWHLCVN